MCQVEVQSSYLDVVMVTDSGDGEVVELRIGSYL